MVGSAALAIHHHRLAQPPPDHSEEAAEHVELLLALEFPQINIEVDLLNRIETKDRQYIGSRPDPQLRALRVSRARQHCFRARHRKHRLAFGVLAHPVAHPDEIEDRLPVLHRGFGDNHVRQRPHQVRVEEAPHVIPQKISHTAILPGAPTKRSPVSLDQRDRGTPPNDAVEEHQEMPKKPPPPTYVDQLLSELTAIESAYAIVLSNSQVRERQMDLGAVQVFGHPWAWVPSDPAVEASRMELLRQVRDWAPRFRLLFPHPTPTVQRGMDDGVRLLEDWLVREGRVKHRAPQDIPEAVTQLKNSVTALRELV